MMQGCPQDVKSQDRDETETFHFPKLSRPRQDETFNLRDRDVPKTVSRPQCRSLKTPTGEVCHLSVLTTCFLRVRSIIFFVIYPQAWCIASMFIRLKSRYWDRDVISSRLRRDRDVRFFQTLETEMFNLQDRDETFQKTSWDRLKTKTFKTETTSLLWWDCNLCKRSSGSYTCCYSSFYR